MRRPGKLLGDARFVLYSLLVHGALLALLLVNLTLGRTVQQAEPPEIIHAVTVDEEEILQEQRQEREATARQQAEEERRQREAEEARQRAEQERQRQEEAAREQRRQEEQARQEAQRQRQAEQQRQAEERRQQEEAERQRRAEEEHRRQEEAERQRRAEEERRKQEEAERQRRAEEERRKQEEARREAEAQRQREAELQRQIEEEQAQQAAQQARVNYVRAWGRMVENNWSRPLGSAQGLSADVRVRLQPSGDVVSIEIVKSSGDATFDRSVENAIRRASPLPVPEDAQTFRRAGLDDITFRFKPD